jgi:hypothetical protein
VILDNFKKSKKSLKITYLQEKNHSCSQKKTPPPRLRRAGGVLNI